MRLKVKTTEMLPGDIVLIHTTFGKMKKEDPWVVHGVYKSRDHEPFYKISSMVDYGEFTYSSFDDSRYYVSRYTTLKSIAHYFYNSNDPVSRTIKTIISTAVYVGGVSLLIAIIKSL